VGLLKEEMRRLGSLVMRAADASRVPAGAALAVDREQFAEFMTRTLSEHPLITVVREAMTSIPESTEQEPVIIATGPLTSEALSADIARIVGRDHLYFYDAISPIVLAETIDRGKVFRARDGTERRPSSTGSGRAVKRIRGSDLAGELIEPRATEACGASRGRLSEPSGDARRHDAFTTRSFRRVATVHDFTERFEGCLPISDDTAATHCALTHEAGWPCRSPTAGSHAVVQL
jgi:methylenetetrahydrofolate--tRNA-(uracil-5-)-methyltransferase